MIRRQHVVREFFNDAEAMRRTLDDRFKDSYNQGIQWNYFCDPRMYTYLHAAAQVAFPKTMIDRFMQRLRQWCLDNLGLVPVQFPSLHLMVNGCRLNLHSDFHNGSWGYVYSLTRWETRKFFGGETLLLRDGIPSYKKHHVNADALYELIPAQFNQLLLFDDRIVHGTATIEGSMDPCEGRMALVGHIRATAPMVRGSIPALEAHRVVLEALPRLRDQIKNYKEVQGTISFRLEIAVTGKVESVSVLSDNIVTPAMGYEHSDAVGAVKSFIQQMIAGLKFPPSSGKSQVIVPVLIPLPDLRPIEFAVPHSSSRAALCEWITGNLSGVAELEFQGSWEGSTFVVREPIPGSIAIEPHQIAFSFNPPMWVPSQRERFQVSLAEWAKSASEMAGR